jgi:8-hydroxy-5-deazaflavin:NADPH oxidoreductase
MNYSIIGFGKVGQALARAFARKGTEVVVASRRAPEALAPLAREIGPTIILAIPFWEHREIAKAAASWQGKIVIDATNAFGVPLEELDGLPSSVVIARAIPGARLVKAFNHLAAGVLAQDPRVKGGRRVVFLSSDDESATGPVAALAEQLGFAPVGLGRLEEGGALVQARGRTWTQLIFQDLVKFE